jgi:hypothetical protein
MTSGNNVMDEFDAAGGTVSRVNATEPRATEIIWRI